MRYVIATTSLILLICQVIFAGVEPEPYQKIEIKPVFSKLIIRDNSDRTYSGQIKSKRGLTEFEKAYGIDIDDSRVDFEMQMLVFGITDDITTRIFQFLKQKKVMVFTLDYAETGIKYKLRIPEEGKKHSYMQVFVLKKIEGVSHIRAKNHIRNGLSKVFD